LAVQSEMMEFNTRLFCSPQTSLFMSRRTLVLQSVYSSPSLHVRCRNTCQRVRRTHLHDLPHSGLTASLNMFAKSFIFCLFSTDTEPHSNISCTMLCISGSTENSGTGASVFERLVILSMYVFESSTETLRRSSFCRATRSRHWAKAVIAAENRAPITAELNNRTTISFLSIFTVHDLVVACPALRANRC